MKQLYPLILLVSLAGAVTPAMADGDPPARSGSDAEATAPSQDRPLYIEGDVRPPVRVRFVKPVYPESARARRIEGRVILEIVVDGRGKVESATILKSNPTFDESALAAVKRWRYRPALKDGKPVRVYLAVIVDFALK